MYVINHDTCSYICTIHVALLLLTVLLVEQIPYKYLTHFIPTESEFSNKPDTIFEYKYDCSKKSKGIHDVICY